LKQIDSQPLLGGATIRGPLLLGAILSMLVAGCSREGWQRAPAPDDVVALFPWFATMRTDIAIRPYKMPMLPVEGTVPITGGDPQLPVAAPTPAVIADLGRRLPNPISSTATSIERGRERYDIYCAVCHGPTGNGDGTVAQAMSNIIPSLNTDRARAYTDGYLYAVIQDGRGLMRAYSDKVRGDDRWHIINYVRVLQGTN